MVTEFFDPDSKFYAVCVEFKIENAYFPVAL